MPCTRWILIFLLAWVTIDATILSSRLEGHPFYDLLIVIPCHGSRDVDRRAAIRNSWAQYATSSHCEPCRKRKVKILFVAGQEGEQHNMRDEAAKFGDLGVLPSFGQFEYYTDRAEKTQRSLRYAIEHFRFRLLLKTDTDSWIFVDRLLQFLEDRSLFALSPDVPGIYGGDFADGTDVYAVDDPNAKWFDGTFREFTGERVYPKHAKGAGYLLSPDLVEFIASMGPGTDESTQDPSQSKDVEADNDDDKGHWARKPRLEDLPSEDVSVGFWLQAINHTKIDMPVSIKDTACTTDISRKLVVDHYVAPAEMTLRWCRYIQVQDPCDETVLESTCPHAKNTKDPPTDSQRPKLALLASALRVARATRTAIVPQVHGKGVHPREGSPEGSPKPSQASLLSLLRAGSPKPSQASLLSLLRAQQRLVTGTSSLAATVDAGEEARTHARDRWNGGDLSTQQPRRLWRHLSVGQTAGKVVGGEKHAWMLMQHGAAMSWVSGHFPQS